MNSQAKFSDPYLTAGGEKRAFVDLGELSTLWFNTGSLCNLSCEHCYIESSPRNDRLLFITDKDIIPYLDELDNFPQVNLIGLTGGEPFANPHILDLLRKILDRNLEVLVLTNAYRAIRRYRQDLLNLKAKHGQSIKIRVSLDHYTTKGHEQERGAGTYEETLDNLKWLVHHEFSTSLAGRSLFQEEVSSTVEGYQSCLNQHQIPLRLKLGENMVIFPEMDKKREVPEITTKCWDLLHQHPKDQMCASERMIVKNKEDGKTWVMPCTLLAYDEQFRLGRSLKESKSRVQLNHPFCAEFCVLGGSSCSSVK